MEETRIQRVASYGFITADGHVLLSLLNSGPNQGRWTLVGGGIEFGESPKEALLREAMEEAGIEIDVEPVLWEVSSHTHQNLHFIGIIHRVELPKILPCKADGDGFSSDGTRWFQIENLDVNSSEFPIHPTIQRILKRL